MKLTVSNTAMMKPLLHANSHTLRSSPPLRVVGLLESSQVQLNQHIRPKKLLQYSRPGQQYGLLQTAKWQEFLPLENAKNLMCVAVFGFVFDGTRTWYQVWNCSSNRACWLLHNDYMNYDAFAILTMDALVSLLPKWDGKLYKAPYKALCQTPNQAPDTTGKSYAVYDESETIDAEQINTLLVSDASTSATGQLWFLVTINSKRIKNDSDAKPNILSTRSGWISPKL